MAENKTLQEEFLAALSQRFVGRKLVGMETHSWWIILRFEDGEKLEISINDNESGIVVNGTDLCRRS